MMTSKFFGGVRGFATAGNSMRTRIFLFLFFASTSGLWAQEARQVREAREERVEEAQAQEARELPQGREGDTGTTHINNYGLVEMGASVTPASEIVNRRIRVGEKKDEEVQAKEADIRLETFRKGLNGPSGNGNAGGMEEASEGGMQEATGIDWLPPRPRLFVRGDVNGDSEISAADALAILNWLNEPPPLSGFLPFQQPAWTSGFPCHDAADANDDGVIYINDAMTILIYVFLGIPTLPAPSPSASNYIASDCGEDLTGDSLGCDIESAVCN